MTPIIAEEGLSFWEWVVAIVIILVCMGGWKLFVAFLDVVLCWPCPRSRSGGDDLL